MKKLIALISLVTVLGIGGLTLTVEAVDCGPPCPDPCPFACPLYYDPVVCLKPCVGWQVYSNACFAACDCAVACEPWNSGQN